MSASTSWWISSLPLNDGKVWPRTSSRRPAKFEACRSTRMVRARKSISSAVLASTAKMAATMLSVQMWRRASTNSARLTVIFSQPTVAPAFTGCETTICSGSVEACGWSPWRYSRAVLSCAGTDSGCPAKSAKGWPCSSLLTRDSTVPLRSTTATLITRGYSTDCRSSTSIDTRSPCVSGPARPAASPRASALDCRTMLSSLRSDCSPAVYQV